MMMNTKDSTLEEPLIHISIWIRNDAFMNEEDDEFERRSLPMKQIKERSCTITYKQRRMRLVPKNK